MAKQKKKTFFQNRTKAQIKKYNLAGNNATALDLHQITPNEYIIIDPLFQGNAESAPLKGEGVCPSVQAFGIPPLTYIIRRVEGAGKNKKCQSKRE